MFAYVFFFVWWKMGCNAGLVCVFVYYNYYYSLKSTVLRFQNINYCDFTV